MIITIIINIILAILLGHAFAFCLYLEGSVLGMTICIVAATIIIVAISWSNYE
jgi:hypothetical protein